MTLSPRLSDRSTPALPLNDAQRAVRQRILDALTSGRYAQEDVDCFCGEQEGIVIAEVDRYALPVRTVLCTRCGLMRTTPRMTAEATAAFYANDYRALYTGNAQALLGNQIARGRTLLRGLPTLFDQISTVYDVGCGVGGMLMAFAEHGKQVAGCDYDREYLQLGRDLGLELVEGDADALLAARDGQSADLVTAIHVVEHFLDLPSELARLGRAVRPGGFLLIEVPGIRCIDAHSSQGYRGDPLLYLQNAHTYHFTAATLRYVLTQVGFEVIYADEAAVAVARRPEGCWPNPRPTLIPQDEARRVLSYLATLERRLLERAAQPAPSIVAP